MNPAQWADLRGRRLAHFMWDELEKIGKQLMSPSPEEQQQAARSGAQAEEESPVQQALGNQIEKTEKNKARGFPILPAPPGYVFNPELQAFMPDMAQQGWMTEQQAAQAQNNQGYYQQGQQAQATQGAQAEADTQAAQRMQQLMAGQQQAPGGPQTPQTIAGGTQAADMQGGTPSMGEQGHPGVPQQTDVRTPPQEKVKEPSVKQPKAKSKGKTVTLKLSE